MSSKLLGMPFAIALMSTIGAAFAQSAAQTPISPVQAAVPAETAFRRGELEALLKPVALFPDPLLAQLLPASAYPLEIVQAARWLERNKTVAAKGDFSAADALGWDASVKALLRFPDIIGRMNADLDWTSDLGDAFVNQPEDVAVVIQDLRRSAQKSGVLKTTSQQQVVQRQQGTQTVIVIEPAQPDVIYVPTYDPGVVYGSSVSGAAVAGLIGFGTGIVVGSLINDNSWNWGTGIVYPPVWPGYPAYRPGLRPGSNVNIGNEINIGGNNNVVSGNNIVGNSKPWRPDPDRYRPGQGTKPGLASVNRPERPTSPDRPGMGTGRPSGIADRPARIDRPSADRPSVDRPAGAGANRPGPAAGTGLARPTPGIGTAVARPSPPAGRSDRAGDRGQRPVTREAPGPSVFGGADLGRGASLAAERGAASRAQVTSRAGGGAAVRPVAGRGGGAAMGAGGGRAGGGAMRGGGPGHR